MQRRVKFGMKTMMKDGRVLHRIEIEYECPMMSDAELAQAYLTYVARMAAKRRIPFHLAVEHVTDGFDAAATENPNAVS